MLLKRPPRRRRSLLSKLPPDATPVEAAEQAELDAAGQETAAVAMPLTLASLAPNAVVSAAGVAALTGTGIPVTRVEVRHQHIPQAEIEPAAVATSTEESLGEATVDERGPVGGAAGGCAGARAAYHHRT